MKFCKDPTSGFRVLSCNVSKTPQLSALYSPLYIRGFRPKNGQTLLHSTDDISRTVIATDPIFFLSSEEYFLSGGTASNDAIAISPVCAHLSEMVMVVYTHCC